MFGGAAAANACIRDGFLLKGYAACADAGKVFNFFLAGGVAAPHGFDEAVAVGGEGFIDFIHSFAGIGVLFAVLKGFLVEGIVNFVKFLKNDGFNLVEGNEGFFAVVAGNDDALAFFNIFGADFNANGNAFHFVLGEFPPGGVVTGIDLGAANFVQALGEGIGGV